MEISRLHCDKINIGGDDVSYKAPDTTANGTLVANGPVFFGVPIASPNPTAVLNIGPTGAAQAPWNLQEELETALSMQVDGNTLMVGNPKTANTLSLMPGCAGVDVLRVQGDAFFSGAVDCGNKGKLAARFAAADASPKPFDLEHPTKGKGHRLRHACIEGPEVAVYYRGRLRGSNTIELPYYWKDLVAEESISVQLQPIGDRHFHLNVVEFDNQKIIVKESDDKPIDCFYHVYGERKDINPLITEYEGDGWEDYPDPNYDPNKVDSEEKNTKDPRFAGPPNTITK